MRQVAEGDDGHQDGYSEPGGNRITGTRQGVLANACKAFLDVVLGDHAAQGVHDPGKIGITVLDQVRTLADDQGYELSLSDGEAVKGGNIFTSDGLASHKIADGNAIFSYRNPADEIVDGHEVEEKHQDDDEDDVACFHAASHQIGKHRDGQDYCQEHG